MATEVVVTQFILDTQQFDRGLDQATKGMLGYDKAAEDAEKENKNLGTSLGSASAKFKETKAVADGAGKGIEDFGNKTGGTGSIVQSFKGQLDSTFPIFGKIATGAKTLGASIYTALGPIGLIVGAVVLAFGALVKIFAGTEEGMDRIDKVIQPLKAQFQATIGLLQTVGKVAADTVALLFDIATFDFSGASESFDALQVSAGQAGAEISNFGNTLREAGEKGARLAEIKMELDDLAISIATNESRINREFQEQYAIAGNVNATSKERKEAAEQAIALQKELTALKIKELDIQIEQLEIEQSLNDTSDEEKLALAKLKAARDDAKAEEISSTRRVRNTINALDKEATSKAIAESKARADAARKAQEEEVKAAQAQAKAIEEAQKDVNKVVSDAARARELAALSASERELYIINEGYQKQVEAAKAAFAKLNELTPAGPDGESLRLENAAIEAETLANIEQELVDKKEEIRKRDTDNLRAELLTQQEIEREAVNAKQDALVEEVERLYSDGAEKTAALELIESDRQEKLAAIITESQQQELDRLKAQQDQQVAIIAGVGQQLSDIAVAIADGQIASAKEASKALIGITIDSVGAVVKAKIVEIITKMVAEGSSTGPIGAAAGLAAGTALGGILQALLNKLKSSLTGAYTGERNIGGSGEQPVWSGKDGYIRRVHKGEDIMAADKTKKYRVALDEMHKGTFDQWLSSVTSVNNYSRAGNTYVSTTTQQQGFNDSRIVGTLGSVGSVSEQRRQTMLLAKIASGMNQGRNKRYSA